MHVRFFSFISLTKFTWLIYKGQNASIIVTINRLRARDQDHVLSVTDKKWYFHRASMYKLFVFLCILFKSTGEYLVVGPFPWLTNKANKSRGSRIVRGGWETGGLMGARRMRPWGAPLFHKIGFVTFSSHKSQTLHQVRRLVQLLAERPFRSLLWPISHFAALWGCGWVVCDIWKSIMEAVSIF